MRDGFVVSTHHVVSEYNGIMGYHLAPGPYQFVGHDDVSEVYHEIWFVFKLVLQAAFVYGTIAEWIHVRIGLHHKGETFVRWSLGVKSVFGSLCFIGRIGLAIDQTIKILFVGREVVDDDFGGIAYPHQLPTGLLGEIA